MLEDKQGKLEEEARNLRRISVMLKCLVSKNPVILNQSEFGKPIVGYCLEAQKETRLGHENFDAKARIIYCPVLPVYSCNFLKNFHTFHNNFTVTFI